MNDKNILYLITIIIDLFLILIYFYGNNKFIDKLFIKVTLICHIIFYYALLIENSIILDFLHIFVFLLPLLSIFTKSKYIKLLVITFLILIQALWIIKKECILHNLPTNLYQFGFGNSIKIFVWLLILILVYQMFTKY